jgi:hypothetical protein
MNQLRTKYYDFSAAMLMGSNEVPTNNSTAMGTATLKFNNTTKVFTITVTHDLSSITSDTSIKELLEQMERSFSIHCSCISNYTSAALTPEQEADLMANLYYVNLHSTFTAGEIRGQLVKGTTTSTNTGEVTNKTFLLMNHVSNLGVGFFERKFNVNRTWNILESLKEV